MMFNSEVQPLGFTVLPDEENNQLQIAVQAGFYLPAGPGQMAGVPLGVYRFPINKETALNISQALADGAKNLKDDSDIIIASTTDGLDEIAKAQQSLKG